MTTPPPFTLLGVLQDSPPESVTDLSEPSVTLVLAMDEDAIVLATGENETACWFDGEAVAFTRNEVTQLRDLLTKWLEG